MRTDRTHRRNSVPHHYATTMIIEEARETTRQTFEHLHHTATPEQHELLVALEQYVDMLHDIIDQR